MWGISVSEQELCYALFYYFSLKGSVVFEQWMLSGISFLMGYLLQTTLRGCAANMGSKISLLVYKWPLTLQNAKFGTWLGGFFKICPNFEIWAKMDSNLRKIGLFCSKFGTELDRLVYEWVFFSWKICICMGLFSTSVVAHPHQTILQLPPRFPSCCVPITEIQQDIPLNRCRNCYFHSIYKFKWLKQKLNEHCA